MKYRIVNEKILGADTIIADGQTWHWNEAYHVYNSTKNYDQLSTKNLESGLKLQFDEEENE